MLNTKPAPDAWSAGQLASHVPVLEHLTGRILQGKTSETARDPEAKIDTIRSVFLNFDRKLTAP